MIRNNKKILLVHWNEECNSGFNDPYYTHSTNQDLFKKSISILGTQDIGKLTLFNIKVCYTCMSEYFNSTEINSFMSRAKSNHYSIHPMVKR